MRFSTQYCFSLNVLIFLVLIVSTIDNVSAQRRFEIPQGGDVSKVNLYITPQYERQQSQLTLMYLGVQSGLEYVPRNWFALAGGLGYRRGQELADSYTRRFRSHDLEGHTSFNLNVSKLFNSNDKRTIFIWRNAARLVYSNMDLSYTRLIFEPDYKGPETNQNKFYSSLYSGLEMRFAVETNADIVLSAGWNGALTPNQSGYADDQFGNPNKYTDIKWITPGFQVGLGVNIALNGDVSHLRSIYSMKATEKTMSETQINKQIDKLLATLKIDPEKLIFTDRQIYQDYMSIIKNTNVSASKRLEYAQKFKKYYERYGFDNKGEPIVPLSEHRKAIKDLKEANKKAEKENKKNGN
ncbi:MAG: hypothetical protein EAZ57_04005 [Cytophagales bacterium]|nr:MAG: hypothetical protein EAZ67_05020 [Cytophagales bacterium]TAF61372.1 MAG: hypothetical protein EAZ57_04005 [Cytophagales bacterium]